MEIKPFIQIPNIAVWDYKKEGVTLIKDYGDKILYILSYLDIHMDKLGVTRFTLEDMICSCGMTPRTGQKNSNNQFASILDNLCSKNIITIAHGDYKKAKDLVSCIYKAPVDKIKWFPIYNEDYNKIMASSMDRLILLNIYSYISARLKRSSEDVVECMYVDYVTFSDDLDITETTLSKYLLQLKQLGILYCDNIGLIRKHDYSYEANNVYCFDKAMLARGLISSKLYYESEGFTMLGKKTSKEMESINGITGRILQLKKDGMDTKKLEKKLVTKEKNKKVKKEITTHILNLDYNDRPDIFNIL